MSDVPTPLPPSSGLASNTNSRSASAPWSHVGHHRTRISPEATFDEQDSQIKHELLALITQYLQQEGYTMSSATIQDESNVKYHGRMQERDALRRLSLAIMDGDWDLVAKLLGKHLKKFHAAHQGFLYAVCKQEYLELIDRQEYQKAFTFLTTHLKPLEKVAVATSSSRHEFKELCYLLTCKAVGESDGFRDWEGVVRSREKLVEQLRATFALEEVISPQQDGDTTLTAPQMAMPDNRLMQLLHQSVAYQMEFSRYHPKTIPKVTTLLRDFECDVLPNAVKCTYIGHSQNVKFVTFVGTDGELLASGSSDGTIKLWPTEVLGFKKESGDEQMEESTGTICRQWTRDLLGHSSRIWYLSASPSGERLYSGSGDGTVKVWDLRTALDERVATQQALEEDADGFIGLCEADATSSAVEAAASASTVELVASATYNGTSTIAASSSLPHNLSVTSAECLATLISPNGGDVYTVNLHPSETHLVTGGYDQSVRLWDISTGAVVKAFRGHFASVCDAQFNRHANFIVSGSKDGTIRLWDILSGLCVHTLRQTLGEVTSIAMALNGYTLLSGSRNNSNRLWDLRMLNSPRAHLSTGIRSVASSGGSSGSLNGFAIGGNGGIINGYAPVSGVGISLGAGYGSSHSLSGSSSVSGGITSFSGSRHAEQRPLQRFKGHQNTAKNIVRASFGPRDSFVLGGSEDGFVYVWEVATGKLLERLSGHRGVTYNARWHEKQALLASSSHDGTVKTWWWQDKAYP
ncbi:WD40 repeat-containing protein [Plasmopara halstedii]|uniref:WD40 repeat-containing protein SMU1 n=1 Tax=Plasmopara halstedii TaxID=4781 RepID=A0A0P1B0G2_PLAHL|nr:WD40 repeat-containing protein [Plasmopara halstedii]CEG48172.1 WD40 repeat-containing protein [Plasmopara halstedii]|eukprot:XP_024584541.1 WD40 repeat-containing protein [Plasmopara halstedii]